MPTDPLTQARERIAALPFIFGSHNAASVRFVPLPEVLAILADVQAVPVEPIVQFARQVIEAGCDGGDVDGGDIQDWAVEAGLLVPTTVTEPCDPEDCRCAESGDFPQTCYRLCTARLGAAAEKGA